MSNGKLPENREEQHNRFELRALIDTSRLLIESYDLDFIVNNLLLITMGKLMVTKSIMLLYKPDQKDYEITHIKGKSTLSEADRIEMNWSDSAKEEAYISCGSQSSFSCPNTLKNDNIHCFFNLRTSNHHLGFLALGSKLDGSELTNREVEFVESLSIISAVAVSNSRMFTELRHTNRQLDRKVYELNTLFDLSKDFNMMVDFDEIARVFKFAMLGQLLIRSYFFLLDQNGERKMVDSNHITDNPDARDIDKLFQLEEDIIRVDENLADEIPFLRTNNIQALVGLRFQKERLAVVGVGPRANKEAYQDSDLNFLNSLGNLALLAIQKTFLLQERIEKERIEEELNIAKTIQQGLLPEEIPQFEQLEVAGTNLSSYQVGGDYFDVLKGNDTGDYYVAIADVTGKGIPASLLMANLQSILHTLAPVQITMTEATGRINDLIYENTPSDKFITFFWARLLEDGKRLKYVNAGHNPPIVLRNNSEEQELLDVGGLILGAMPSMMPYEEKEIDLNSGDVVVLYTDGVTEAQNDHEEEFGEERLFDCIKRYRDYAAQEIMDHIVKEVRAFSSSNQFDDITLVVLKAK